MLIATKTTRMLLAVMFLSILQIVPQTVVAQASELNTISIFSPTQYSAKLGVIEFSGEIKQGAPGSPIVRMIGIDVDELAVGERGYYSHNFYYGGFLGFYEQTWGDYSPERSWPLDNGFGGKFVITADTNSWPIGLHQVTLLALDSSGKVITTKPVQFYIGNAKEAQPKISVPTSVEVVSEFATIIANVQRNQFTNSPIVKIEVQAYVIGRGTVVPLFKSAISQDGKLTVTIDYRGEEKEVQRLNITITDANGLVSMSEPIYIIPETIISQIKMSCIAPSTAVEGILFNLKCNSDNVDESSRISIRYQYKYLDSNTWSDFADEEYFGKSLTFGIIPKVTGIQSFRVLYDGSSYSSYDKIAPFTSNVVKVNVSKNPVTPLTVKVSYPRVVILGKSYTANVLVSPASSGMCSYHLFYRMRILIGQSNLKNGKSSLTFPAAVAGSDAGNPATLTVVCTAGKSTGTGFAGFNWVRK
jgi:hypothetical protein